MKTIGVYVIATIIFFVIDIIWIGVIAKDMYKEKLGFVMAAEVNWKPAIIFYLLFIGGILYFAVLPALKEGNWQLALMNGAILGMLCYATYDLTNMATIKDWPLSVTIIDIIWGTFLTGSTSLVTYYLASKLDF
jgi:uncharacterized membrane protein